MTSKTLHTRIINKHALEFDWIKAVNFIPKQGEIIVYDVESTDGINLIEGVALPEDRSTPYTYERFKIGDGIHYVNDLPFSVNTTKNIESVEKQEYLLLDGTSQFSGDNAIIMNDIEEIKYSIGKVLPEYHYKVFIHNGCYRLEASRICPDTFELYKDWTNLIKIAEIGELISGNVYNLVSTMNYPLITPNANNTSGNKTYNIITGSIIGTIDVLSGMIEFNEDFLNDNISLDGSYAVSELYAAYEYKYQSSGNIAGGNWSSTSGSKNTNISGKGTVGGENNYLKGTQGRVHGMSNTLFSRHGSADGFHNFVEATSDDNINDSVAITGYANYILDASGADASGHHNMVLKGIDSTAKGFRNIVKALYGFVHGQHNIVTNDSQTVLGKFNDYKKSQENGDLFTVGNGKNFGNGKALVRSNAFGVKEDGTAYVKEQGDSADSVVKKEYVDDEISKLSSKIDNSSQVAPEFVQDISQCVDTTKMYVLPDGFIYAYSKGVPEVTYETHLNSILTHSSGADRYTLKTGGKYHLKNSNVLPAKEGDIFEYYGFENYNAAVYWLKEPIDTINEILDSNIVGIEKSTDSPYDSAKVTMQFTAPAGTHYVLFASISNNANSLDLKVTPPSMYYWMNTGIQFVANIYEERIQELENELKNSVGGVLGGKKYVACGDSFTSVAGAYPYHIAERNNMELVNLAVSGSDFTNMISHNVNAGHVTRVNDTSSIEGMFEITAVTKDEIPGSVAFNITLDDGTHLTVWDPSIEDQAFLVQKNKMYLKCDNYIEEANIYLCSECVLYDTKDGKIEDPFSADIKSSDKHKIYTDIPIDADYITLMFGLNECNTGAMPPVGDKTLIYIKDTEGQDTTTYDDTNLWGAYSKVFDHLLSNVPYAKIGVIIADAWMNKSYANAVKEICKYWGIPYLDLNDETVPMGIRGRYYGEDVSPRAIELRDAAFKVSDTDEHPNAEAHKYRSTIIENFMRSL